VQQNTDILLGTACNKHTVLDIHDRRRFLTIQKQIPIPEKQTNDV
jgi:hypothetical protein